MEFGKTVSQLDGEPVLRTNFEEAGQLYVDVQPFNNALLILSIIMVLCAALLYFTATNKRRNYYITNYVATGVTCAYGVGLSLYAMIKNSSYLARFKAIINDAMLNAEYQHIHEVNDSINYVTSTWNFALCYVIYILIILLCVALVLNLLWKIKLMKGEKALLAGNAVGGAL